MIYPYSCACGEKFDVIKPMADAQLPETCKCGQIAQRIFVAPFITGTKIFEAEFYPGLGKVIHNKRELNNHLAKNDLVAIGNDWSSGEKMQKEFDQKREEANDRKWDKALENISL